MYCIDPTHTIYHYSSEAAHAEKLSRTPLAPKKVLFALHVVDLPVRILDKHRIYSFSDSVTVHAPCHYCVKPASALAHSEVCCPCSLSIVVCIDAIRIEAVSEHELHFLRYSHQINHIK